MSKVLSRLAPGVPGLEIACPQIGPGLVIGHGYASVIWAGKIGEDCTIYHNVSVGLRNGDSLHPPTLGDRVWIWPGARVIGVKLGDDCTVGTNAVVLHDVESGSTVVGIPARSVKPRG